MKYEKPTIDFIYWNETAILTIISGGDWSEDLDAPIDGDELDI